MSVFPLPLTRWTYVCMDIYEILDEDDEYDFDVYKYQVRFIELLPANEEDYFIDHVSIGRASGGNESSHILNLTDLKCLKKIFFFNGGRKSLFHFKLKCCKYMWCVITKAI